VTRYALGFICRRQQEIGSPLSHLQTPREHNNNRHRFSYSEQYHRRLWKRVEDDVSYKIWESSKFCEGCRAGAPANFFFISDLCPTPPPLRLLAHCNLLSEGTWTVLAENVTALVTSCG
jgi:hypothetical protein